MKALVVYDSTWGNTENVARAIAAGIGAGTNAVHIKTVGTEELDKVELLVIGSPVISGRSTQSIQDYLKSVTKETAARLKVASFDTRLSSGFATMFGNAATRIAKHLENMGSRVIAKPKGFIVSGQKGPLADGEIDRAAQWGRELAEL
jgi:flavodoxin I